MSNTLNLFNLENYFFDAPQSQVQAFKEDSYDKRVNTYGVFKYNIIPAYEDEKNKKGGEYGIELKGAKAEITLMNQVWEKLVLDLVSNEMP